MTLLAGELRWEEVLAAAAAAGIALWLVPGKGKAWNLASAILCLLSVWLSVRLLGEFSPETQNKWTALILLLLAAYGANKGRRETAEGGILLLWLLAILVGGMLISGFQEIRWENICTSYQENSSTWKWVLLLMVLYLSVCTDQMAAKKEIRKRWEITAFYASAVSLTVQGVLGDFRENTGMRLYELSRSIQYLGGMKRYESLIILSVILGFYLWISYIARGMIDRIENIRKEIRNRKKIEKTG